MKIYLLLFIGFLALLFGLPPKGTHNGAVAGIEQSSIKKGCARKSTALRRCLKACLHHQTHSERRAGTHAGADCGQQLYAMVENLPVAAFMPQQLNLYLSISIPNHYLSPYLKLEPDPPRFS